MKKKKVKCTCTFYALMARGWKTNEIKGHHEKCPMYGRVYVFQ
jgi:hypothetical protein